MNFTAKKMQALYKELAKQIDLGDFSLLPEVHATSAGLKAYWYIFCT